MSDALLGASFVLAAAVSLATSWVLVSRLERVGARLGLSEALLGMLAALAADAPEITSAVTALAGHHARIGAGVVIGSNVFNIAALLGLGAAVARRIELHRKVIVLEGAVAVPVASICLLTVVGVLGPVAALIAVIAVLVPYGIVLGRRQGRSRWRLPSAWERWLADAVAQEETELAPAIHPRRGRGADEAVAALAVLIVVGASVAMEQAAASLGERHAVPGIVTGALILAGVTSLPNAVAAIYLAARGRGAATLSTALHSNALNVALGLLVPGSVAGLGAPSGQGTLVAAWYLGLTVLALVGAYLGRGLGRGFGVVIICAYAAFVAVVLVGAF